MKQLEIKDFKAFKNRIYFELGNPPKNMLLFGENGSGKTSVYEAIKLCFYRDRLLKPHQTIGAPAEQKANEERDFYRS
jgi:DNA repair exonuclease SbcCD ATPase subunit